MNSLFAKRSTSNKSREPLNRGERAMREWRARQPAITRQATMRETVARNTLQAAVETTKTLQNAPRATLRFAQFFRAYIRAFAAGFGVFLLVSEISSGHFNPFTMLASHVFAIVAGPFYAVMLAPAIFALYNLTGLLPIRDDARSYALTGGISLIMLTPLVSRISELNQSSLAQLTFGLSFLIAALFAAYRFNGAANTLRALHRAEPVAT